MRWPIFFRGFLQAVFVLYCIEAGVFLILVPWREAWQRLLLDLPISTLHPLLLTPIARGAVSGFGLVHLVWGAHDLRGLLGARPGDGATDQAASGHLREW